MTPVPDGRQATVVVDALPAPPERSRDEVSRIEVRDADGLFWDGALENGGVTRKGATYRIVGRCLAATAGGTLVVDVLGPGEGAVDGQPSAPMSGSPVATLTVRCDGTEAALDLERLPVASGPLAVNEATSQVAHGWVVLTRTS